MEYDTTLDDKLFDISRIEEIDYVASLFDSPRRVQEYLIIEKAMGINTNVTYKEILEHIQTELKARLKGTS